MTHMNTLKLPEDKFVNVGSVKTRYWTAGQKGFPIILIHGLGQSVENWMYNIEELAKHFKVYALDLVGFGKSDKPKVTFSYSDFAQFLNEFMITMNIEKANLIGHSLGGAIVLKFALDYHDKVNKLVIVGSEGLGKEASLMFRIMSLPLIGELIAQPSRKGTEKLYKECVFNKNSITDEMIDLGYEIASIKGWKESFLNTLRATINFFGYKRKIINSIILNLNKIESSTLIIWGQQDKFHPIIDTKIAKKSIPDATIHVFDKCGHVPMIEYPKEFNSIVKQFF